MTYILSLRDLREYLTKVKKKEDTLSLDYLSTLVNASIIEGATTKHLYQIFDKYSSKPTMQLRKRILKRIHEEEFKERAKPSKLELSSA